jgi:primosomal protein N'
MGEREHCTKHQRYFNEKGQCSECTRETREARDEGAMELARELVRHFPNDAVLRTVLIEMGYEV